MRIFSVFLLVVFSRQIRYVLGILKNGDFAAVLFMLKKSLKKVSTKTNFNWVILQASKILFLFSTK